MQLMQLVYASRPFGYDELTLAQILLTARKNNRRADITGALICREDLFVQLLEGGQAAVDDAFARIERDDRHTDVTTLLKQNCEHRLFPAWDMLDDPARSWMWTPDEVRAGLVWTASANEVTNVFERLSREVSTPCGHRAGQPSQH